MDQQALCSICDTVLINDTDTVVSVKERGLKKLIEKSIEKEDRKSELWLGKIEVSCSCKTNCLSARCGCKKSGLKCNKFCKSCQGQSCDNASARSFNLEDDENEDKEDEERDDSDDENDDDGNVYEDENDGEEETTVEDGEQENEAICTGRKTVKNTRSKVSTQKIFCGCRTNCASARCSCRKSSLKCNELCKFCHGDTCNNSINAGVDTNEDSEYETHKKANDKDEETPTEEENEGS
ncbi:101 kDa malaria antigen-like isoform X1 [Harmonia axyridis]|uniref:101 kDa malaria antigen-like isoform X1 n=1 Tax=Harmonia axyridis TaxID=115357 RepID=UPI001E2751DC|nr:101 kDa malaria antigen-like isoform X1 [Harmonia axyridis]XP_045467006.1 101 kDa malaria antigen-like isoform X1 [Harmonia axyridis]